MAGLLSLAVLLGARETTAQDHVNVSRGFWSEHAFDLGEIDHVNTFSGNLILTIPIGGRYPVNALSYQFQLVGNSQIWQAKQEAFNTVSLRPDPTQNAGAGFLFTLGQLLLPNSDLNPEDELVYLAPDGSKTRFWNTLHPEDVDEDVGFQATRYSRSSNYLRLRVVSEPFHEYELDFGNGQVHLFDDAGQLLGIEDPFGNTIFILRSNPTPTTELWSISDGIRSHTVELEQLTSDGVQRFFVRRVNVAAFDGTTATWEFDYVAASVIRACPDTAGTGTNATLQFLESVELPDGSAFSMSPIADSYVTDATAGTCKLSGVIKQLRLPTLGFLSWDHQVVFLPQESVDEEDGTLKLHWSRPIGVRERRKLSADGTVEGRWTYRHQAGGGTPNPNPSPDRWKKTTIVSPLGDKTVHHHSVWPDGSSSPEGYDAVHYGLPFSRLLQDGASGTFISSESFDCDANPGDPSNPTNCLAVRQSFVRYESDTKLTTATADLPYLNQRLAESKTAYLDDANRFSTYEASAFDGLGHYRTEVRGGNFPNGTARTTTTAWNSARGNYPGAGWVEIQPGAPWILGTFDSVDTIESVKRCESETTDVHDAKEEYCFDSATGFLRAKRILKSLTGARSGDDVLRVWNADVSGNVEYESWIGGDGGGLSTGAPVCSLADAPPASDFRMKHTYSNGVRATSKYTDDDNNTGNDPPELAFLALDRTIDAFSGAPSSARDVSGIETSFDYDSMGRLIRIDPTPANGAAEETFTYTPANMSSSGLATVSHLVYENGNNPGLVLFEEEARFDSFGRVTRELRRRSGSVQDSRFTYYNENGWRAFVSEWGRTSNTGEFGVSYRDFDPFGRPREILRELDGPTKLPEVTLEYVGDREVSRTVDVGSVLLQGGEIGAEPITTTERYDHHGRLVMVVEPSDGSLAGVETSYVYDSGNRLRRAKTNAPSLPDQVRCWTYDGRGALDTELHPEKSGLVDYGAYDAMGHALSKNEGGASLAYTFDRASRLRQLTDTGSGLLLKEWRFSAPGTGDSSANGRLWKAISQNRAQLGSGPVDFRIEETFGYGSPAGRLTSRSVAACLGTANCTAGSTNDAFQHSEAFDDRGQRTSVTYPICLPSNVPSECPAASQVARTVSTSYFYGLPTAISPAWATSITHHPNELWSSITHGNGVVDEQLLSVDRRARPKLLQATKSGNTLWRSGTFLYDPAGNITGFGQVGTDPDEPPSVIALDELDGADRFLYDRVQRLRASTISVPGDTVGACLFCDGYESATTCRWSAEEPPLASCDEADSAPIEGFASRRQDYEFDLYGNIQSIATDGLYEDTTTNEATNRLTAQGASFDGRGNLLTWTDPGTAVTTTFAYDALNRMQRRLVTGEPTYHFLYTADDERILTFVESATQEYRWTLRDFGGKVLRAYRQFGAVVAPTHDYIFRGDQPLGEVDFTGGTPVSFHLTLDHLGTPRLKTDASGAIAQKWKYFPFGEEAVPAPQQGTALRFTGHERDQFSETGASDDVDYLHSRNIATALARFTSVDRAQGHADDPQSWNRYAYGLLSPMIYRDVDGREAERFSGMMRELADNPALLQGHKDSGRNATAATVGLAAAGLGATAAAEYQLAAALGEAFAAYGVVRGNMIERILSNRFGGGLPRMFPVIDRFFNGVATSVKSLDLGAKSYQDVGRLVSTVQGFVAKLAGFEGGRVGRVVVAGKDVTNRVLELVVQAAKMTPEQAEALFKVAEQAKASGVVVKIVTAR